MCAERNAIANMITNGEHQLDKDSGDIEILVDFENRKTVHLKELIPDWWGKERFGNANYS